MEETHRKPLSPGHTIAGYSIIREIGRGGFGIVYEALNPVTQDRVAIKQFYPQAIASWHEGTIVVKRADDKELVTRILARFEDEAFLQFNFDHPNILRVKNFVRVDNTGYLITEYIDGTSLVDFLKPHGNVFPDWETFRRVMQPVADAVRYVHERLALHRDISPDNILIDKSGRPVLVDFGAAKVDLRRAPSASSIVSFKEAYAPVEQQVPAAERPEGRYTDIYALAGTMYCTLAGYPPARAVDRALASKDPYVPISQAAKVKCPEAIYSAIDHGLTLAAAGRPQTVEAFMHSLGWLDRPPPAGPGPISEAVALAPSATAPSAAVLSDDQQANSRWKPYAIVALLVGCVGGGLFLSSVGNDQSPSAPTLRPSTPVPSTSPLVSSPSPAMSTSSPKSTPTPTSTPTLSPTPTPAPTPDLQAREAALYQTALSCIRTASATSCNIDHCLAPYRSGIGFENRYPALRAEFFKLTERCNAPTPTPTPTPTPDLQAREATLYQTALSCLRTASATSCNIDHCLAPYRSGIGFENRYPALRSEFFKLTERCNAPTPTPTPTPTSSPTPTPSPTSSPRPSYVTFENRDIDGGDLPGSLPHLRDVDQFACQTACNNEAKCVGFSYGKWDRACYLKGSLPDLRFEPNSTSVLRSNQSRPPDFSAARRIETARRAFVGNRYSTSSTSSRQACSNLCTAEEPCLAFQYIGNACWRYDHVDFATKDDNAQAGIKRQPAP